MIKNKTIEATLSFLTCIFETNFRPEDILILQARSSNGWVGGTPLFLAENTKLNYDKDFQDYPTSLFHLFIVFIYSFYLFTITR